MSFPLQKLLSFLDKLRAAHISYELGQIRDETVLVAVKVPGERWEVEFFADGSVEVEIFRSSGDIWGRKKLAELFSKFGERDS
jgi:hypothetical protein